ncbi:MAG: PEP-utilizing enzyme [Candidatus Paceibacterota bacterium]|jgi:phosphohistidine swiveling domain-containing protein
MHNTGVIELIKKTSWHADWSGLFPLVELSTSFRVYFDGLQAVFGKSLSHYFVFYENGVASARLPDDEYEALGRCLGGKLHDAAYARHWASEFKRAADDILEAIHIPPAEFLENLESFDNLYETYGAYNVGTKIVFDVMFDSLNTETKSLLEDARKYSETFYKDNGEVFSAAANIIVQKTGYEKKYVLMMTREELLTYVKTEVLPTQDILSSRYDGCGIYFSLEKGTVLLSATETRTITDSWMVGQGSSLSGTVAYVGKVVGKCRIVLDYQDAALEEGEILVTGMTDPYFVPLMKKAAAIVTDGGGMLSHAAIVARELKKPCIVGTKFATQVLHDGDLVEVDADRGVVRKLT